MAFFTILKTDTKTKARRGVISTEHGDIQTPAFFPVGTQGTVKSLSQQELWDMGARLILGNTYHLYLRPGADIVAEAGGLHEFQQWKGALFTDSGGFQVFSLGLGLENKRQATSDRRREGSQKVDAIRHLPQGMLAKVDEEGVTFRSHLDGSIHRFTPEISLATQHKIGADIILSFDECAPHPASYDYTRQAMERTHRWAKRGLDYHQEHKQSHQHLFGIVQGGVYEDLRVASAKYIDSLDFDGYCVGGVSVGESKEEMDRAVRWTTPLLDPSKPRHLLGVGDIDDMFRGVEQGIDTFDCVTPTRWGRNGTLIVHPETAKEEGSANPYRLIITNNKYRNDFRPLDPRSDNWASRTYSRAYLHHLFRASEILGVRIASYHNVATMLQLAEKMRASLEDDSWDALKKEYLV